MKIAKLDNVIPPDRHSGREWPPPSPNTQVPRCWDPNLGPPQPLMQLARKAIDFGERTQKRAITPFKVIQGHRGWYQSKTRKRVLHPISYRFGVIAAYCSNSRHFAFFSHPLGEVLIELLSLGVTAETLRANIGSKSAISLRRGSVDPKFQVEGVVLQPPFFFS